MFDTMIVSKKIKEARNQKNMTQMDLADAMGVSYQAVSNWERGNSMPDISKLPELCNILGLSFEELVGGDSKETQTVKKMMEDENTVVTLEELVDVAPIMPPKDVEKAARESAENEQEINISTLIGLAPFLDRETLDGFAAKIMTKDIKKLNGLAPFLSKEILGKCVNSYLESEGGSARGLVGLYPFLGKEIKEKLWNHFLEHGNHNELIPLAPFMGKGLGSMVGSKVTWSEGSMSGNEDNHKASGKEDLLAHLDEDQVASLAKEAYEEGKSVEPFLDYMDEDDVGKLAMRMVQDGKSAEDLLDYMDEDDVAKVANLTLEKGLPVECYLDYMDEDAMKELIVKVLRRK